VILGDSAGFFVEGKYEGAPVPCVVGTVLTLTVDMTARTFTAQSDSQTPVTVQWPQCPSRLYLAVALYNRWSFTLL
jgi:hypothetical protein